MGAVGKIRPPKLVYGAVVCVCFLCRGSVRGRTLARRARRVQRAQRPAGR